MSDQDRALELDRQLRKRPARLGVGKVAFQSLTICFQNSPCVSSGNCMPSKTFGYSGPQRKIAHAASWPAEKIGGIWSGGVLPSLTLLKVDGSVAERPRATWSITKVGKTLTGRKPAPPL